MVRIRGGPADSGVMEDSKSVENRTSPPKSDSKRLLEIERKKEVKKTEALGEGEL